MAGSFKNRIVEIAYQLKDKFTKKTGKITSSFKKVEDQSKKSSDKIVQNNERAAGSFSKLGGAAKTAGLVITAAIGAIATQVGRWTQAAADQERAEVKLATTLRNLTGATKEQIQALIDQAAALQQTTGYGDEATISAQAMLATFQLTADEIAVLTPRLLDMAEAARKTGQTNADLETLAIALGKAFTSGVGALSRYGIAMDEAQISAFKLGEQQQQVQILAEILDGNFKGLAVAVGAKYEGAIRKADAAQGDLLETLGFQFTQNEQWISLQAQTKKAWESIAKGIEGSSKEIAAAINIIARVTIGLANTIRISWNTIQIAVKLGASVITRSLAIIVEGLSKITFGEISEGFKLMAEDMWDYSSELVDSLEEDGKDIQEAGKSILSAFTGYEDGADKAENAMEKVGKATKKAGALAGSGGLAGGMKEATKALKKELSNQETIYKQHVAAVKKLKNDQVAIIREFADLVTDMTAGMGAAEQPDFIDVNAAKFEAAKALAAGNFDTALENARKASAMLKDLRKDSEGSTIALLGVAKELERIGTKAAEGKTEEGLINAEKTKTSVELLKRELESLEANIPLVIDASGIQSQIPVIQAIFDQNPIEITANVTINETAIRAQAEAIVNEALRRASLEQGGQT